MRLTVLGSGTCVPSGARNSSGYWLEWGDRRVRLDCGSGTVHAMARYGLDWEALTHQVITHFHIDHVGELPALLFAFKYGRATPRSAPLEIVGPKGLEFLVDGFMGLFKMKLVEQEFPVAFREIEPGSRVDLGGGATLRAAKTPHTGESLAVRVDAGGKSVGYTGDTGPGDEVLELFDGLDLLVAECSFVDDAKGTKHLTADDLASIASRAGVRHLLATHSYFDPEAERLADRLARGFAGEITVAADGLAVDV